MPEQDNKLHPATTSPFVDFLRSLWETGKQQGTDPLNIKRLIQVSSCPNYNSDALGEVLYESGVDFHQLADYHASRTGYPVLLGLLEITDADVEQVAYRLNDENNPAPLLVCAASALVLALTMVFLKAR